MKTPHWFKRLDSWTDRQPLAALVVVAVLCLTGLVLAFWIDSVSARQQGPIFVEGFLAGLLFCAVLHVADAWRKTK